MSKKHKNYFELKARNYFDLGFIQGGLFSEAVQESIDEIKYNNSWDTFKKDALLFLKPTQKHFPSIHEEVRGYAHGAHVSFEDFWTLIVFGELDEYYYENCTTVITNNGQLIAHNEDWCPEAEDYICVLKKILPDVTILELCYLGSLGGNSISINSYGTIHVVNSLSHKDFQIGVPKNIIGRWLSETNFNFDTYLALSKIIRSSGYHHSLINKEIKSIETSAKEIMYTSPKMPFCHTNHYLTELKTLENTDNSCSTFERYDFASKNIRANMSYNDLRKIMEDTSLGKNDSLSNKNTIAKAIIDFKYNIMDIWLLREKNKDWISYPLDFIKK